MTSKTKIFGIAFVVAVATSLLIYVPLTLAVSRNNNSNEVLNPSMSTMMNEEMLLSQSNSEIGPQLLRRFIANSTLVEIHGTVVALVKRMLVLNTADGQVRILLPATWIVGEKVLEREDLFKTDYLTVGQDISVKTLKGTIVTRESYNIYVLFGYEIINTSAVHAYAVLPFNIGTP
jgi:hypothetical protein